MFYLALEYSLGHIIMFLYWGYSTWLCCNTFNLFLLVCFVERISHWSHENVACKMPDATNTIRYFKTASLVALLETWTRPCFLQTGWHYSGKLLLVCSYRRHGSASEATLQGIRSLNQALVLHHIGAVASTCCFSPSALCFRLRLDLRWSAVKWQVPKAVNRLSSTFLKKMGYLLSSLFRI